MIDELFEEEEDGGLPIAAVEPPLAVRMRPRTLDEVIGQDKVLGKGTWLRSLIERDKLVPMILYGPPGVGKTTLAKIIARETSSRFEEVSAIGGGVSDLRRVIEEATNELRRGVKTILFVDEIHRFSKSQQDALLHAVEDRTVVLVGATTENPYFEVNNALLSRMRVVQLSLLSDADIERAILSAAVDERGLASKFLLTGKAVKAMSGGAAGDARAALTTLDLAADIAAAREALSEDDIAEIQEDKRLSEHASKLDGTTINGKWVITLSAAQEASPRTQLRYDKEGDEHYDIISAFIKSMRGSDPDATVYWLARMVDAGEDPKFIARRIFICAAEDVGLADPQAVVVAETAFRAAEVLGYPECRINLSHAALYVALAPKSNSAYLAIDAALDDVRTAPGKAVPSHLRDRNRPGSADYEPYRYPHDFQGHWVSQRYLPEGLEKGAFYSNDGIGWEGGRVAELRRLSS